MKKAILIILAISLYSTIFAFVIDTNSRWGLFTNGATHQMSKKGPNGYNCIIEYVDKNTKQSLITGFEKEISQSCPDKSKIVEITQQEALQIVQTRLNNKDNSKIILPTGFF